MFKKKDSIKQFLKFSIVGVSNTLISFMLYLIFLFVFEKCEVFPRYNYLICSLISFCIGVVWSFYWNNRFTFKGADGKQRGPFRMFVRVAVSYSFTGIVLQNALLFAFVECWDIPKMIAPIIGLVFTVPINFILNKYWAFGEKN